MARPRKLTDEELLDRSMTLFWSQGYQNTSLKDLEKALNLTAPSIYHAFGSKEKLFLSSIDHYLHRVVDQRISQYLRGNLTPIENIKAFFLSVVDSLNETDLRVGCLLTNTATEVGGSVPEIADKVQGGIGKITNAILKQLEEAKQTGYLDLNRDVEQLASTLLLSYQGLLVISRLGYSADALVATANKALEVLDSNSQT